MEKDPYNKNQSDEIDLLLVLEKGLAFIKRSARVFLIFVLLGLVAGLVRYLISPTIYKSRSLMHSIVLTNQEEIEMIDNWNHFLTGGEYEVLSQTMNTDVATIKKLKKISAEEIQKLYIQNNPNGFAVDIWVTDTAVISRLQSAIVYGLGNSSYVKERVDTRKERYQEMIGNVKKEMSKLESTKAAVDSVIRLTRNGATPFLVDISSLNAQWIGLNEKLLSYEEELKFSNAVQIFQDFSRPRKPVGPSLIRNLIFGMLGGLFLGYLAGLYLLYSSRLRSRKQHRNRSHFETLKS